MANTDLTTLAAVRTLLQMTGGVTEQDDIIGSLITRMSSTISRHCQREFAPAVSAASRTVELDRCASLQSLAPFDCRAATAVVLDTGMATEQTLATTQWQLALHDPSNQVWQALRLCNVSIPSTGGRTLTVTGDWGYESVPAHVEQACILAVVSTLRQDVQAFGGPLQPNSFGDGVNDDQALPPGVRGLLAPEVRHFYR